MSSNKKKTPVVVVLCDSSSSLRLVPYDESAHLDAYDAFMRDPQMLLDTKTEATTKDTWRAILSNNQTIESGVEQFMIDVLGDDGKRTCIGDVSSHDVPSCDVEEDDDDDEEEEEDEDVRRRFHQRTPPPRLDGNNTNNVKSEDDTSSVNTSGRTTPISVNKPKGGGSRSQSPWMR